jgi:MFS family permease
VVPAPFRWRDIAGVAAGNILAFYDFVIFSFFSPQIGRTFFPSNNPHASLEMALGAFGVGFFMRPAGALLIGRVGDRIGRKPALLITFTMMGVGVAGLALTPGYSVLGIWAPTLAVTFRLLEGLALGGDMGPATAWLIEMAPTNRKGLFVSAQYAAQDCSVLLAGCVGLVLSCFLSPSEIDSWGWRVAFLLGGAIFPVGIGLRRMLPEPVAFMEIGADQQEALGIRKVVIGFALLASSTVASYSLLYLAAYVQDSLALPVRFGFATTAVIGVVGLIADPVSGWLSDRFGRRAVIFGAWLALFATTLPSFVCMVVFRSLYAVMGASIVLAVSLSLGANAILTWIAETMPRSKRSQTVSIIYALAVMLFGSSTQVLATWLIARTGSQLAPGLYMTVAIGLGLAAIFWMPAHKYRKQGMSSDPD